MDTTDNQVRAEAAQQADPTINPWGAFVGGSVGHAMFFWYPTQAAIREALVSGELEPDAEPDEWAPVQAALTSVFEWSAVLDDACFDQCRAALEPVFDLLWLGRFNDLCTGDGEVPTEVREDFLEWGPERDEPVPQISPDQRADFGEFLRERYA